MIVWVRSFRIRFAPPQNLSFSVSSSRALKVALIKFINLDPLSDANLYVTYANRPLLWWVLKKGAGR